MDMSNLTPMPMLSMDWSACPTGKAHTTSSGSMPESGPFGHEVKAPGRSARRRLPRPVTKLFLILA
ncbi:hypothetical protein ACVWZD_006679 [Streptomyces sp. TE3672]